MPQTSKKKFPRRKPLNQCCLSYQYKQMTEAAADFHKSLEENCSQNFVQENNVSAKS